jgi:WD40 repeat protein
MEEEVEFIFSNDNTDKKIKIKFKENQIIDEVLNNVISSDNSLSDIKIINLTCNNNQINRKETFKNNNIINNDIILVEYTNDEENNGNDSEENEGLIIFEFNKFITEKAYVNKPSANLRAIIDRTFDVFKSLNNKYLLICSNSDDYEKYDLLCYDILSDKIIFQKNEAHSNKIYTCIHYLDEINKRDLLITGSFDKTIKIWKIEDEFKLLYEKIPDYNFKENTYLLSECLLFNNNDLYLITSAYEMYSNGYDILFYDLYNNIQDFNILESSQENVNYLESYYYDGVPLIISGNYGNIKIFNFKENKLIKEFNDKDEKKRFNYSSCKIHRTIEKNWLISSCYDGYLHIWDYDNPLQLINKINSIADNYIVGLELINNQILFVGGGEGSFKEYDLKNDMESEIFNSGEIKKKEPTLCLKYIKIDEDNYLFVHNNTGIIEFWK